MTERRRQILDAAWSIADESGLGAVTLHEVARRVGIRQPSLYAHVASKAGLYDAMFAQAYEQLLAEIDQLPPRGSAREQLVRLSRAVLDFAVASPPRQQLLFQRTIPGFEPSPESYAIAKRLIDRCVSLLSAFGAGSRADVDVYTALVAGLGAQQIANEPGGDRWTRHLEAVLDMFLDHFAGSHHDPTRGGHADHGLREHPPA
ncbi:TetR/AcrR family transcriptional regulator [Paractinoplanes lichenicola]|uniref:TetR/AcrR family transcriptional regulator n=1 Tax=Paractinoplanes lichenicola TaxID=2802976 RepID=A0ABS1VY60_9ACTN|nr:TetR/AcrR family transcriptional regulator [Actinoplanes lichenicola]MBL7259436.1 TetR/AcrR family transcriptional regulator [Actinoplanes lichenicola]